ncbi:MAG: PD-(D/E)XK nuclease family protein [Saprospiraceae bacterium]|nr:PD-(D/E)XK nuclease family protein [Saprospiraceae bacterium]
MNIFKILGNGDGRINEPNISAFLGYLLDPYQDHGLGFEFLSRFLKQINLENFEAEMFDYEIILEQAFREEDSEIKKKEIVDIILLCFKPNKGNYREIIAHQMIDNKKSLEFAFLIENKVNVSAKKELQLQNQYVNFVSAIRKLNPDFNIDNIISLYVTPDNQKFDEEFQAFKELKKAHIKWILYSEKLNEDKEEEEEENLNNVFTQSIYSILNSIISDENQSKIDPINDYTKQTIKAFVKFIENDFKSQLRDMRDKKEGRRKDGEYTKKYVEINISTNIEQKLVDLRNYIANTAPELKDKMSVDMSTPTSPALKFEFDDYIITIYAGTESRDKIRFLYGINPKVEKISKQKLIDKFGFDCLKKANYKTAYCKPWKKEENIYKLEEEHYREIFDRLKVLIEDMKT